MPSKLQAPAGVCAGAWASVFVDAVHERSPLISQVACSWAIVILYHVQVRMFCHDILGPCDASLHKSPLVSLCSRTLSMDRLAEPGHVLG